MIFGQKGKREASMGHLVRSLTCAGAAALALATAVATGAQSQGGPGQWVFKAPLPSTWTEIVSVAFNGKLYAFRRGIPG